MLSFSYGCDARLGEEIGLSAMAFGLLVCPPRRVLEEHHSVLGGYNVVSYVDTTILQLFLGECFQGLPLKSRVFKAPQPLLMDWVERLMSSQLASRVRRLYG